MTGSSSRRRSGLTLLAAALLVAEPGVAGEVPVERDERAREELDGDRERPRRAPPAPNVGPVAMPGPMPGAVPTPVIVYAEPEVREVVRMRQGRQTGGGAADREGGEGEAGEAGAGSATGPRVVAASANRVPQRVEPVVERGVTVAWRFYCLGCRREHTLPVVLDPAASHLETHGPVLYEFNGDPEHPTFAPSFLLVRSPVRASGLELAETRCHAAIADGIAFYLHDSTHDLAGVRVPLPTKIRDFGPDRWQLDDG